MATKYRGSSNSDVRGNSHDRRVRRLWIIETFGVEGKGKPLSSPKIWIFCLHCGVRMRAKGKVWEIDCYPVCRHDGGRYVRGNIVPSCRTCNNNRCTTKRKCRYKGVSAYG